MMTMLTDHKNDNNDDDDESCAYFHSKPAEAKAKYRASPDSTRRNRGSFDGGGLAIHEWDFICNIIPPRSYRISDIPMKATIDIDLSVNTCFLPVKSPFPSPIILEDRQLFPDLRYALIFLRVADINT